MPDYDIQIEGRDPITVQMDSPPSKQDVEEIVSRLPQPRYFKDITGKRMVPTQETIGPTPPVLGAKDYLNTGWEGANKPLIDITPKVPENVRRSMSPAGQVALGAGQGLAGFTSSLTSPISLATLGAGPALKAFPRIARAISGAFGVYMAKQTADQVGELIKLPKEQRNPREIAERLTNIALSGGAAGLAAYDAALAKHPALSLPKAHEAAAEALKTKAAANAETVQPKPPEAKTEAAPAAEPTAAAQPQPQPNVASANVPTPVSQVAKQPEMALVPEHKAVVDQVASENGDKVVYEAPTDPNEPFARQIAAADRKRGVIRVNPQQLSAWLTKNVPKGREANAIASLLSEERIHLSTPDEAAQAYHDSLSAPERAIAQRVYAGPYGKALSPLQLGHEALRMRLQKLARMDVRETIEASLKEWWTVKSLLAASDAIRGVRETLGTKASKQGLAIIDRIQGNLDAAIKATGGQQPGATRKQIEDDKAEYDRIGAEMQALPNGMDNPRFQELWKQREAVKNRHGGYTPGTQPPEPGVRLKQTDISNGHVIIAKDPIKKGKWRATEFVGDEPWSHIEFETRDEAVRAMKGEDVGGKLYAPKGRFVDEPDAWAVIKNGEPHGMFANERQARMMASAMEGAEVKPFNREAATQDYAEAARKKFFRPDEEPGATRKHRDEGQQEFFLPPIPKEAEVERPTAADVTGYKPEERAGAAELAKIKEQPITAEQIDTKKEGAYRRVPENLLGDPHSLGRLLTEDAARSGKESRTTTKRITVLEKPGKGVWAVSTYRDPSTGRAMLAHPDLSGDRERIGRSLPKILADGWVPKASILLKDPVTNYRRHFPTIEAMEQESGFPKGETVSQDVPNPTITNSAGGVKRQSSVGFENERPVPIAPELSSPTTSGMSAEQAGVVHDHFSKAPTIDAAVAGIRSSPRVQALRAALITAMDAIREKEPNLSQGQAMEKAIGEIYDEARSKNREAYVQQVEQAQHEGAVGGDEQVEPGVGEEMESGEEARGESAEHGDEPAAINKHAREEAKLIAEDIKGIVAGQKTEDTIARAFDAASNTPHILAERAGNNIRLASAKKPKGALKTNLTEWERGNKEVLSAANALVQAQAIRKNGTIDNARRGQLAIFKQMVTHGESAARAMISSGSWRQARLGRAWLRAAESLKAELDYAEAHWNDPELQETARRMKRQLDEQWARERAAGIDVQKEPGYTPQRYDAALWNEHSFLFGPASKILGKKFRQPRTFDSYYEAIKEGPYLPVTRDGASLVSHRVRQGMERIYRDQWKESLKGVTTPSGQPLALDPVQGNQNQWQSPRPDYQYVDLGGKGLAVHDDFVHLIKNLTSLSEILRWPVTRKILHFEQMLKHTLLIGDFFHLGRMGYYGASIMGKNLGFKGGWSLLDIAPRDMDEAVRKGVIRREDMQWARGQVKYGNGTISRQQLASKFLEQGSNLGKIQDALYKDLISDSSPTAGPTTRAVKRIIDPTVGAYNRQLFDRITRGLMAEANVREYERQMKAKPNADPNAIIRDISRDVNNYFGNIGRQGWAKSATMKDMQRMFFLAPDWVEGLVKKEYIASQRAATMGAGRRGLTKLGTTGRGIGRGVASLFGLTQAINLITRGKFTWQNEEKDHKGEAFIPWGESGVWFSPLSVFNELTHDVWHLMETDHTAMQAIDTVVGNKESPLTRAAIITLLGSEMNGQKPTSSMGQLKAVGSQLTPSPITFGRMAQAAGHAIAPGAISPPPPGSVARSLFGAAGIKVQPGQDKVQRISAMAQHFLKESGLKKETGWVEQQTDEPSYSKFRSALRNGDHKEASKLYQALRGQHTDSQIFHAMKLWKARPFTGSKDAERKFIRSLDDRDLETYSQAQAQRIKEYEQFLDFAMRAPEK